MKANNLREFGRRELVDILDSCGGGGKALKIDTQLSGPLSLIAEYSLLKEHGIDKVYHLNSTLGEVSDCVSVIYLCRPSVENMEIIAQHIKPHPQDGINNFLYFVPWRSVLCERVLEEEGIIGQLNIGEFHLDLFPLDEDLLSFELNRSCFKKLYQDGDFSCVNWIAKALMKLQMAHGFSSKIVGKGVYSKMVAESLLLMKKELPHEKTLRSNTEIDFVIILDRNIDLITPLLTQLTYEGILDEEFGINHGTIELSNEISGVKDKKKFTLNSSDVIYGQIRDLNISSVGAVLNKSAKKIKQIDEERSKAKSVSQLKEFVSKLGGMLQEKQSLQLHTCITEYLNKNIINNDLIKNWEFQQTVLDGLEVGEILNYIENMVYKNAPLSQILRLLCLVILNGNIIKQKQFDQLKQDICHVYGFECFLYFEALIEVGLFKPISTKANLASLKKNLRLLLDNVDEKNPDDISYVYSGYAPITVRLVEFLTKELIKEETKENNKQTAVPSEPKAVNSSVWKNLQDQVKVLPGPVFEFSQPSVFSNDNKKNGIVVFVGGCTFAEVAAIRYLSQNQSDTACNYSIITTDIINGSTMMDSLTSEIRKPAIREAFMKK